MHDVLRQRLVRKIESLPDEQIYQVLDFIEFLESKYAATEGGTTTGLQRFAEGLEDKLRRRAVSPNTIREAFQLISAADRVLSGVSSAGRQILDDLGQALDVDDPDDAPIPSEARAIEADPRKRRSGTRRAGLDRDPEMEPKEGKGSDPALGRTASDGGGSGDDRASGAETARGRVSGAETARDRQSGTETAPERTGPE